MSKTDAQARQAQIALVLAKFGRLQNQDRQAVLQKSSAALSPPNARGSAQPPPLPPAARRQTLADGRKRLEQAIWGKNPAPGPSQGGWVNENIADTINRTVGGGDVAKSIDNVLAKFSRKSTPKPQPTKGKGVEPGQ